MNFKRLIAIILVGLTVIGGIAMSFGGQTFWFPAQASTVAYGLDLVFHFITWLSIFFFVLIIGLMFWFAYKYQRVEHSKAEGSASHNTPLELTWTIVPLILVIAIFYVGMEGYLDLRHPPLETYNVRVTGQRWSWSFDHPNGASESGRLLVPVNTPVKLILSSQDVIHAAYIPAFRVKMDAVPGRETFLWFEASQVGDYDFYCAEYCGKDHSQMAARVVVVPEDEFRVAIQEVADEYKRLADWELPEYAAKKLYPRCASCHLFEDKSSIGPSWRETNRLWGKERVFTDGTTATVDENYVRESMLEPQKHVVERFTPAMPTFKGQLKDRQIYAVQLLIKFIDHFDDEGNIIPGKEITEADFNMPGSGEPAGELHDPALNPEEDVTEEQVTP